MEPLFDAGLSRRTNFWVGVAALFALGIGVVVAVRFFMG
jgi:hypothetical protein